MRAFFAIDLPKELKKSLTDFIAELQRSNIIDAKFVKPEQLHLTLKFLGEIHEPDLDKIKAVLSNVTNKTKRFELQLKGFGHFNYKVLCIGGDSGQKEAIGLLAEKIDSELNKLGFEKESRPYAVHLTLARVKWWKDKDRFKEIVEKYKEKIWGSFAVNEVKLMRSVLSRTGPVYSEIASFPLVS